MDLEGGSDGVLDGAAVGALEIEGVAVGDSDGGKRNFFFQSGLYANFRLSFETAGGSLRTGMSFCKNNCRSSCPLITLDLLLFGLFVALLCEPRLPES